MVLVLPADSRLQLFTSIAIGVSARLIVIVRVVVVAWLEPFVTVDSDLVLFVEEILRVLDAGKDCLLGSQFLSASADLLELRDRV